MKMTNFYSKDFETQDVSFIGRFESFEDADAVAGDNSDWIYRQEDLEASIKSSLKANAERFSVWVLTAAIDYDVQRVDVFISKDIAEREFVNLVNKEFFKDFETPDECYEFMGSEEWWDNDERLSITLSDVGVNKET
jgi:hypothetical protein